MITHGIDGRRLSEPRVSFREDTVLSDEKDPAPQVESADRGRFASSDSLKSQNSSNSGSKYANLRGNLTREQTDRDPLYFYKITKVLGEGSMGSVKLVKKRDDKIGGSARRGHQEAVKRQKRDLKCLNLPLVGGLFKFCIDGDLKDNPGRERGQASSNFVSNFGKHFLTIKDDVFSSVRSGDDDLSVSGSQRSDGTSSRERDLTFAMKSIVLSHVTKKEYIDELRNEIAILKQLDHPHIVRAMETFEHHKEIFIVMELCNGGDLYSRDPYIEPEAARIIDSVLSAVAYMHSRNIAHRDIKYENILFVNQSPESEIKLIDFGLSKTYGDAHLTDGVGTIYTMAPEVLKGNYTEKADMWSIGVVTYMLLSSQLPFYGRKKKQIIDKLLKCQYDFKGRRWKRVSNQAKEFIRDLFVFDPEDRADAPTASRSKWLNHRHSTTRAPHAEEEELARASMLRYAGYSKLKRMALMVVAHKSSNEEIGILRKVFRNYDSRRDGSISFAEFYGAMHGFGYSDKDMHTMFDCVDLDGTGRIRYTEFIAATIEAHGAIEEERLAEAFDRLDSDDSGYISAENLAEMLGKDIPRVEIDEIIAEVDLTKDKRISYADFLHHWESKKETEKKANLRLLGADVRQIMSIDSPVSDRSRDESSDHDAEKIALEARAGFLLEKHDHKKHILSKVAMKTV